MGQNDDGPRDPELAAAYTPLPENPTAGESPTISRRPFKGLSSIIFSLITISSFVALVMMMVMTSPHQGHDHDHDPSSSSYDDVARGVREGVSAKSNPASYRGGEDGVSFDWTNAMFSWQRSAFHFQPEKNWMNDPDGPLYYKGWYHLFYQYNPESAVWGNISWGHAVSTDMIHWMYLPFAMVPDQWYDVNGVWTGSATILPNGMIMMLYTGSTVGSVQVQNLAYPVNLSDPLLLDWAKYPGNPVMVPPPGIGTKDFRDPTTAWLGPNGKWRVAIGSKVGKTGLTMVYETTNFISYELVDEVLHAVPGTGMWECVDFFPVSVNQSVGLDTSANGFGVKHVLKASLDDTKQDVYALGTYDPVKGIWIPDDPEKDVGIGLLVDYGRYYASKTFYDPNKKRRILWGWINETDTEADDLRKGWASLQTIPRTVLYDPKTGSNMLQWPVEEVETLRLNGTEFDGVVVEPGSTVPVNIGPATQLDIIAEFETEPVGSTVENELTADAGCHGGAADRSSYGPFGLLVLADDKLSELTPVFFRPTSANGRSKTYFCNDGTRSSKAPDVFKQVYGSTVPVLVGEKYSMRVLVDHSIVESFGQGGRIAITSRIYPTEAIYGNARLFLFNNATDIRVKVKLGIWQLNSAFIHPFSFDNIQSV
ncbi:PREDICTED: acid beta-fructofuranosidase-like [Tarenaya hassleriana]|uniref:acid beta-fructofuranosidase-like n=1 Tax=Tarenaya hassleriana TaxID=28532 RepID=UPI00053C66BF|nr:PREDICTED: acid beta-fructofuranosidase-like [Tarenaya hassleriana]